MDAMVPGSDPEVEENTTRFVCAIIEARSSRQLTPPNNSVHEYCSGNDGLLVFLTGCLVGSII